MAAAWGLQTKMAIPCNLAKPRWNNNYKLLLLLNQDGHLVANYSYQKEGKKLPMSWEQRDFDSSCVCTWKCGENLDKVDDRKKRKKLITWPQPGLNLWSNPHFDDTLPLTMPQYILCHIDMHWDFQSHSVASKKTPQCWCGHHTSDAGDALKGRTESGAVGPLMPLYHHCRIISTVLRLKHNFASLTKSWTSPSDVPQQYFEIKQQNAAV